MKKQFIKESKETLYKGFVILGILLILYYLVLKLTVGFISFSNIFFLVGIILLLYGTLELKYKIDLWNRIPKKLRNIFTGLFVVGLCIFIVIEGRIIYEGHHYDREKPDYLMILGAGLRGDKISTTLLYRLEKAIEFNKQYPDVKIIVSGGQGEGEYITEALAMKNYLISHGIDESLIISEDKSTNTYENFLYTKNLLDKEVGLESYTITVISNDFHMYRAKYLGEKVGFKCLGYPAKSHISSTVIFHVREFVGVIKAYILDR